jgi:pyruvate carboxylase subunit B
MGQWALGAVGERVEVEAVDERTQAIRALTGKKSGPTGGGVVRAPMPGLVVRIPVTEGQQVAAGAGLVVVEAMKMENELKATHPGVVLKVHVTPGAVVEKGAPLVTLGSVEPPN